MSQGGQKSFCPMQVKGIEPFLAELCGAFNQIAKPAR